MLMSPAARRSVVGSLGFDTEEVKSPTKARPGRRSTNQSTNQSTNPTTNLQLKQPVNQSIDEEHVDQPIPNKRRSRRLKDEPIIEEDDEQATLPPVNQSINQSNGDTLASQAELEADEPPPQPATNGWGSNQPTNQSTNASPNSTLQAPFGRRQRASASHPTNQKEDDVIADLAEIPDVEAEAELIDEFQVAESNHLRSHAVPALTELDAQLQNPRLSVVANSSINQSISHSINQSEIDLSLLFSCLTAPSIVYESQQVWDFDTLMSEVQSDMYAEGEGSAEPDEKKVD